MKVKELIELLQGFPNELDVYVPIDTDMVQMFKVEAIYVEELSDIKNDSDFAAVVISSQEE